MDRFVGNEAVACLAYLIDACSSQSESESGLDVAVQQDALRAAGALIGELLVANMCAHVSWNK